MKLSLKLVAFTLLSQACAITLSQPEQTPEPIPSSFVSSNSQGSTQYLEKRMREIIINKDYAAKQAKKTATSSSSETPPPNWVRTVNGVPEIVRPQIIAGVTISAKPPQTTDGLEVWVSLKNDGSPKIIKPEIKNGRTKNGRPNYSTYFQTATTMTYNKEQLKAHNMKDDEIFTEVQYIEEADLEDHLLNPIIRCTPERYQKKGIGRDKSTEPFCTPKDDVRLVMDKTYFITWYSRFFDPEVEKVRILFSNIKESFRQKGLKKRDFGEAGQDVSGGHKDNGNDNEENEEEETDVIDYTPFDKRSKVLEHGGKVQNSFYASDWVRNEDGMLPVTILEEWIGNDVYEKKVLISIQPDNIPDDEFNVLENSIVVEFWKGSKVGKEDLLDLKKLEEKYANRHMQIEVEEGIDYEKYIVMITLPMCVVIAAFGMWLFVTINRVDLSHLKKKKFAREKTTHRRIPFVLKKNKYESLPLNSADLSGTKTD